MGQRNKQRRAAKRRDRAARQHRFATGQRHGRAGGPTAAALDDAALDDYVALALRSAVGLGLLGRPMAECVATGLAGLWRESPPAVERAVDALALELADALFHAGWTPVDLRETAQRHLDAAPTSYLVDVIAAATAAYPAQRVDPRWLAELAGVGAQVWWDQRRPLFGQWASRHRHDGLPALAIALDTFVLMSSLFRLEPSLPPPGAAVAAGAEPDAAEERMLAKVRGLLAKAEATEFDEEAEALSAKAQQLMSRYAIDHAMLAQPRRRPHASLRRMWLAAPYVRAKSMLVTAVAEANRCRTVLAEQAGYLTVIGDDTDLRLVNVLATSLLVQATRSLAAAGPQLARSGVSRTRSFRQSFLVAYASRIRERLREAAQTVQADADQSRLLPVLAARTRAVDDALREHFPHLVDKDITVGNAAGWVAGRAAADLALFDVTSALPAAREEAG